MSEQKKTKPNGLDKVWEKVFELVKIITGDVDVVGNGNLQEQIATHEADKGNPHGVTKSQVGLGSVDNTSDADKPVSTAQQGALDAYYQQATGYTDQAISNLIGTAPESMDTLEELAAAIADNADLMDALNAAIGNKANKAEFDTHTGNSTIHVTAGEKAAWNSMQKIYYGTADPDDSVGNNGDVYMKIIVE